MGELSDSVLDDRKRPWPNLVVCHLEVIQEVILHRQLDEEIIENCQDVDSNKGEDEYDSDESELDPQDDSDHCYIFVDTCDVCKIREEFPPIILFYTLKSLIIYVSRTWCQIVGFIAFKTQQNKRFTDPVIRGILYNRIFDREFC